MSPDAARRYLLHLAQLGGGSGVVRKAGGRLLGSLSEPAATELLATGVALAREGWLPALKVLPPLLQALEEEEDLLPQVAALRRVASLHGLASVEALFTLGQPTRELDQAAAARADQRLVSSPLGVLRARARMTKNPDELARLAVVSHPAVVREVLKNPRLTEALVVRVAARRPARWEPLVEIWHHDRWGALPRVRRALVFNPYLPPSIGAKIVPLLGRADLRALSYDSKIHPALRDQAARLLGSPEGEGERGVGTPEGEVSSSDLPGPPGDGPEARGEAEASRRSDPDPSLPA